MKKRLIVLGTALLLALTGCTAAIAAASAGPEEESEHTGADPAAEGYVLTRYGDGIGVFCGDELVISLPVNVDSLRDVDRALIENGIETASYDDALKLLEDFSS